MLQPQMHLFDNGQGVVVRLQRVTRFVQMCVPAQYRVEAWQLGADISVRVFIVSATPEDPVLEHRFDARELARELAYRQETEYAASFRERLIAAGFPRNDFAPGAVLLGNLPQSEMRDQDAIAR